MHPLYFLQKTYWFPQKPVDLGQLGPGLGEDLGGDLDENGTADPVKVDEEPIPASAWSKRVVRIKGLRKRYPDGKLAVRNLSLSLLVRARHVILSHAILSHVTIFHVILLSLGVIEIGWLVFILIGH